MACDLTLYQYSDEQAKRVELTLERFNTGRTLQDDFYVVSLPTSYRPYCGLWRVFPDGTLVYVRTLAVGVEAALERAMQMLHYCNLKLTIESPSYFEKAYGRTEDVVAFGKYRGKRLAEIYYIDPSYVMWLANKYTPLSKSGERLRELAKRFVKINFELNPSKRVAGVGGSSLEDKLSNLSVTVVNIRLQVDFYKPDFYVDQNVVAVDSSGNHFTFLIKAAGISQTPKALHCRSRKVRVGELLLLKSAKIMKYYEFNGTWYAKLGYIKW